MERAARVAVFRDDPSLSEGQEVKSLERGIGGDGVRLLDSRLAVPQSPQHFKVHVDRERWVAHVGRGAVLGRSNVASFPVGCQSNNDGGKAHGYGERKEMMFLGFLEGLPQRDSLCLCSTGS